MFKQNYWQNNRIDDTIINYYVGYSRIVLILQGILFDFFIFS